MNKLSQLEYALKKIATVLLSYVDEHIENTNNPHSVTKTQVGLGNVTNDAQVKASEKGVANGVATLGASGKIPFSQLGLENKSASGNNDISLVTTSEKYTWNKNDIIEGQLYDSLTFYTNYSIPIVQIGNTKWATSNIDLSSPSKFAASPFQYECSFFSFGNVDGHNPTTTDYFSPYNWGFASDANPYVSSEGAKLTGNISLSHDAARVNLGAPWRMPTKEEYMELFNNCDFVGADGETVIDSATTDKRVTISTDAGDIVGIYLKSKNNNNKLFFACSGVGNGARCYSRGTGGYYGCTSLYSTSHGFYFDFYSGGVHPQLSIPRYYGLACRAVYDGDETNLVTIKATPQTNKIYHDTTTHKLYRWSGILYIEIRPSYDYSEIGYEIATTSDNSATSGAVQLDGSKSLQVITVTGSITSISFASGKLPEVGHSCHIIFTASTEKTIALAHTTTGSVRYICPEGTTPAEITIPAGGYAEIDFLRTPDTTENNNTVSWIYVRGI